MAPMKMPDRYYDSLKAAGLTHAEFGTESLSDPVLSAYGKPFDREQVLAIGDDACDLAMYPHARVRVVMGNAPEAVKREAMAMGAVVAPSNDDEGVAWALREFVL